MSEPTVRQWAENLRDQATKDGNTAALEAATILLHAIDTVEQRFADYQKNWEGPCPACGAQWVELTAGHDQMNHDKDCAYLAWEGKSNKEDSE